MSGSNFKHFPHLIQNSPEGILYAFLKKYYKGGTLLLALSGGPDSLCLLHLLLEYQKYAPLKFEAAHINHRLRSVSDKEESQLIYIAKEYGIPLHIHRIEEPLIGNIESAAREVRYNYFQKLFSDHSFEALLLAHQLDDLAETTLKRLFEGAHLTSLGSMKEVSTSYDIPLWRPLLPCKKETLVNWLNLKGLTPFHDEMNFDPAYLRARMRMQLLPTLEKEFGKNVTPALSRIASESHELVELLDSIIEPFLESPYDLEKLPKNPLVLKHFLKRLLSAYLETPSSSALESMVKAILLKSAHKKWPFSKCTLTIDRNTLTISKI